ncbi:MAG: metallophosphoesterase [Deltaproteobacteria bacterium]|nr:metallophosphoesterase [Deltaproteobacteria bacterium]
MGTLYLLSARAATDSWRRLHEKSGVGFARERTITHPVYTLAHLSDSHVTSVRIPGLRAMLNKRILGWCKWSFERRKIHRPEVLDALVADLRITQPDHVAITGDLTNLGFADEFAAAGAWLRQLGDRHYVSLVPGNHDAYVPTPWQSAWAHWWEYLASDAPHASEATFLHPVSSFQELTEAYFPSVRIRGPLALLGVCTAQPVGMFRAGGVVGAPQLARLQRSLQEFAESDLCRVVLIHHPPQQGDWTLRRGLADSEALCAILQNAGAELILHGHLHETLIEKMSGPAGLIPVVGVRSASDIGHRPHRNAQYHLYRIERRRHEPSVRRFRIVMETREYDTASGSFRIAGEQELQP